MTTTFYFARLVLLLVFAVAVASKVGQRTAFDSFVVALSKLAATGPRLSSWLALGIIAGEAATVTALLAVPVAGFCLALGLLTVFAAAITRGVLAKRATSCACFGSSGEELGWSHLVRNGLLIGIAAAGLLVTLAVDRLPGIVPGTPHAMAVALGVTATAILIRWDDVTYAAVGVARVAPSAITSPESE